MDTILNEDWTAEVKGQMHKYRIKNPTLADECGYSPTYLSSVLSGYKTFESEESKAKTKDNIFNALDRLKARILESNDAAT